MKRQELLIGVCVYALIIAIGYSGPLLAKVHWPRWEKPVLQSFWLWFHPAAPQTVFKAKPKGKAIARRESKLVQVAVPDPGRLARQDSWERMAGHPQAGGTGPNFPGLSGKNTLLKAGPPVLPKRTMTPPEPSKS